MEEEKEFLAYRRVNLKKVKIIIKNKTDKLKVPNKLQQFLFFFLFMKFLEKLIILYYDIEILEK